MPKRTTGASRLRAVQWKRFLRAPDAQLLQDLYVPALSRAVRYDRCCAYFSSHVLAVAAQGFAGLIQNLLELGESLPKPAVRLLVNEQLDPEDLEVLLTTGDPKPLSDKLLKQFRTPQDALERDRLAMLAWLVASGWLEVRVGLMGHTQGILHAKFGVVSDRHGDCIAFSGSDNETGQALSENYEELVLGTSWDDPAFTEHYAARFEALWQDRDEQVTSLPLPEAVRKELITLAPAKRPVTEPVADAQALVTAMVWRFIAAAPYLPQGEHACDATAPVELWPHQRRVVEDTARAFPAGRLLCDEVGMGKTIEAVLILRRLLAGRGVRRALLLVPAGLLRQWQDELREKGGLLVPRWENGQLVRPGGAAIKVEAAQALAENDVLLLSREWARLEANRAVVLAAPAWDLVLVDEAHAMRRRASVEREFNSANLLLQLARELQLRRRTRGILLLSATPMQTEPWEPWDLLSVLGVGGRWLVDFSDIRTYYQGVGALRRGTLDLSTATAMGRLVAADPEFPADPAGARHRDATAAGKAMVFCTSAQRAAYVQWLRTGAPLGRRMHRNTRGTLREYHRLGLLELPPPKRDVRDEVFRFQDPAERDCYEAITRYIDRRFDELEQEKSGKGFVMTIFRRRSASSPAALHKSLARRLERLERASKQHWSALWLQPQDEEVDVRDLLDADQNEQVDPGVPADPEAAKAEMAEVRELLDRLEALGGKDSKLDHFWGVLNEVIADGRAVLVFTEYVDTMEYLRDRLRPTYGSTVGCYSGAGGQVWEGKEWRAVSKAEIASRLADGRVRVLVCTDAASEGLNLQAAGALINYDLPWNPSKVEQRIGRIDRIGQRQSVLPIRNLFLDESVDMRVYEVLQRRCGLFHQFVGHMQPVLTRAWKVLQSHVKPGEARVLAHELEQMAQAAEADDVSTNAFVAAEAETAAAVVSAVTRADIEDALQLLEQAKGKVRAKRAKGAPVWRLSGVEKAAVAVTARRELLEGDEGLVPISAGVPVAERVADKLPLPGWAPLVLAECSEGAYRCCEARWVGEGSITTVTTLSQLKDLA
ncbi:MAG: DEAD/DEAH box helicase, partial [Anaerolineae bacterium]